MPLFKEPPFDPKREADHATVRLQGHGTRYNVTPSPYLVPLVGAIIAIAVAAYGLSRPSVSERLRKTPPPPHTLEVELE
jgi:hypothetical protein